MIQNLGINILVIVVAYLIGSIPFAFIVSRFKGVDIRKKAIDGARGASLTWRNVGKLYGILVAALDILKGILVVLLAENFSGVPLIIVLAGLAAIIGHNWSVYMNFTGGKGAATTGGGLVYLLPREFLISFFLILLPFVFSRRKEYLSFPFARKSFKKTNFFSGVFFGILFIVSLTINGISAYSFSPVIFSMPMFLKNLQIKKNNHQEK